MGGERWKFSGYRSGMVVALRLSERVHTTQEEMTCKQPYPSYEL